nr:MAG TPA: hypothetical protein [Caudoviricetes sp.]
MPRPKGKVQRLSGIMVKFLLSSAILSILIEMKI